MSNEERQCQLLSLNARLELSFGKQQAFQIPLK